MQHGMVDMVIVGCDRATINGDVANKIGTYLKALAAKDNNIPFYVAAPLSSIDFTMDSGDKIPIEERDPDEVTRLGGQRIAPEGVKALNLAFDVTPAKYVTAFFTEKGAFRPRDIKKLNSTAMNIESLRLRPSCL